MDWAEKLALEIILPHVECEIDTEETCRRLSTALRKAKADGVKEFALAVLHGDDIHRAWLIEAAECFTNGQPLPPARSRANAIEKGTG